MATTSIAGKDLQTAVRASWFFMLIIALAQIQMGFNVNAITVSMGGIVDSFQTSPSSVGTALVVYSLAVAGTVMLGAKLGQRYGARLAFQAGVVGHGAAMVIMATSVDPAAMILAQAIAGLAAALLVPALVVMISAHYEGAQQSQAIGFLQSAQAIAGVLAFMIAGWLATAFTWRYSFALIVVLAVVVFLLSFRLKNVPAKPAVRIDTVGAVLAALAILLISLGFNNLNSWGLVTATNNAPFDILGMSPVPLMLVLGVVFGQAFFYWAHQRKAQGKQPLLALEIIDSRSERLTTVALLIIGGLGPAVNFLVPLYIQIVQGRTSLQTAVAIIPYSLSIFIAAFLSVRLFQRFTPRALGRVGFIVVAAGMAFLAVVIQNEWTTLFIILGLIIVGLGEGMLLTLMFNVMVKSAPKELAGDVGALRGTANNLSTAVGTALAAVLAVTILSAVVTETLSDYPSIPNGLIEEINLDNIDFVSNDRLDEVLAEANATPEQVATAQQINEEARLRALKISFLVLSTLSLLAIFPANGLPGKKLSEVVPDAYVPAAAPPDGPVPVPSTTV
ncbi:MAG TPA: MFS transporter [Candidatus Limnocylindrales bacterium]|nr:MFS transporter [Candidatus Limnocylindrales bacterium]